jgi:methyl-accepting chemotaxis protein
MTQYYSRIGLLSGTAIVLSAAVITFFNSSVYTDSSAQVYNSLELAAVTLMPYMISAVIAAITAIGVMTILPMARSRQSAQEIYLRLREVADGNLSNRARIDAGSDILKDIAHELNASVNNLGSNFAQLKIINRQQWDLLQGIRQQSVKADDQLVLGFVMKMEENWRKIAEIEDRIRT